MIDRRGFLKLLGALGAASAVPLDALLAAPEAALPVDEATGEGMWWIPHDGKPIRLEVSRFNVEHDIQRFDSGRGYMESRRTGGSTINLTLTNLAALKAFESDLWSLRSGTFRACLKAGGVNQRLEWQDCYVTELSVSGGHPDIIEMDVTIRPGWPLRPLVA